MKSKEESSGIYPRKKKSNRINTSTYCKSDGKEKTNMSFVGIKVCKDGLVAFGDSKSSKYDTFNNLCLDKDNETVQKVFKTENFLLVTFGTNIIPGRKEMKIEDWINSNIHDFHAPHEFFQEFLNFLVYERKCLFDYHFIIGAKDKNGYYIQSFDIQNQKLSCSFRFYDISAHLRNDSIPYSNMFDSIRFPCDSTVDSIREYIKEWFTSVITYFDDLEGYNPVGLPIRIEIFR